MYGIGEYGASLFFGGFPYTAGAGPFIVSTDPAAGDTGVAQNATMTITVDSVNVIDLLTVDLTVGGAQAIVGGVFQAGWTGTLIQDGTKGIITVSTHPLFDESPVDVLLCVEDGSAILGKFTFNFFLNISFLSDLIATTYCEGNRIDLSWTNPSGITAMRIYRSTFAYSNFETDPADLIYDSTPITSLSDTGLDADTFYYYTIFISYTPSAPFNFIRSDDNKVAGLSIDDYGAEEGNYVYNLLPRNYRRRDAEPAREGNQFLLRRYSDFLQCGINLYRGWFEGLLHLKDPDTVPAGRIGTAENQRGILKALSTDFGLLPEESYDAAVLRRIYSGIVAIYKKKGTCQGLINFCKLLTTWDSRCVEAIEPVCGINRLFRLWDGESFIRVAQGVGHDDNITNGTAIFDGTVLGEVRVDKNSFWEPAFLASGFDPLSLAPNSLHLRADQGVLDSAGVPADDGDDVDTWTDQSASSNDAVQTVGASRPNFVAQAAKLDNRPAVDFDMVADHMIIQAALGTNFINNNSASFVFVIDADSPSPEQYLLSIETGELSIKFTGSAGTEYAFEVTSGETTFGVETKAGPQVLVYVFDATAGMAHLYRDGVLLASVAYTAPLTLRNDRIVLCEKFDVSTGAIFEGRIAEVFALGRVMTAAELDLIWRYTALRYNFCFGAVGTVPLTASGEPTVVGILTSLGDFTCVDGVTDDSSDWIFSFEEDAARLRAEISGSGTESGGGTTFTINSIDTTHYPWQFPTPADEPLYGLNAFAGKKIIFSDGDVATIVSNTGTDSSGDTVLTVSPAVALTGVFSIAEDYADTLALVYATREPEIKARFLVGEHSFMADTIWDTRLLQEAEKGPWSLFTGLGATTTGIGFVASPADVTLFVENQHKIVGLADVVTNNTLQDTTQTWLVNEWAGFFVLPNWNQTKLYRIAGNSTDTLFTIVDGAGMDTVSALDSTYVILSEEDALKYSRLVKQLVNFAPFESRAFVKFEEVEIALLATDFLDLQLWLKGSQGLVLDKVTTTTIEEWINLGDLDNNFGNSTKADQPLQSTFSGEASLLFDGTTDFLDYSGSASDFTFLHDGSGATFVAVFDDTSAGHIFDEIATLATNIGFELTRTGTTVRFRIANGTGAFLVDTTAALAATTTARVIIRTKTTGFATQWELRVNGVVTSGVYVGTPSGSAPSSVPRIGAATDGTSFFGGEIPEVFAYDRYLPDHETLRIERYLTAVY